MPRKETLSSPSPTERVLLVDDEPNFLFSSKTVLATQGITDVKTCEDSRNVLELLDQGGIAAVCLDLSMPHLSGIDLLAEINARYPDIPVIVLTGRGELETAVTCMKTGAFDYLAKPVEKDRFVSTIRKALEWFGLRHELASMKEHLLSNRLNQAEAFEAIKTRSRGMIGLFGYAEVVATTRQPVLITGETGVGKELLAVAIHKLSGRNGEFVPVNLAGLDDQMFSDTLFGHKKGAFTGAADGREGLVAKAAGGTLFLDEIGDLAQNSQIKLLRLLQEEKYYPLGSDAEKPSRVRIIVATNQDLNETMADGRFRKDLFYRLSGHHIHIPPLRERQEDITLLLDHFLDEAAKSLGKPKPSPPRELAMLLAVHPFPGNIRELRAMVFDAVARHHFGMLSLESFKNAIRENKSTNGFHANGAGEGLDLSKRFPTLKEAEAYLIEEALNRAGGNQSIASSLLGITRQALNKRLNRTEDA